MDEHSIARELENHEVRLKVVERIVSEQTKVLQKLDSKFTWLGGVIATLLFLMTPQGEQLWHTIIGK